MLFLSLYAGIVYVTQDGGRRLSGFARCAVLRFPLLLIYRLGRSLGSGGDDSDMRDGRRIFLSTFTASPFVVRRTSACCWASLLAHAVRRCSAAAPPYSSSCLMVCWYAFEAVWKFLPSSKATGMRGRGDIAAGAAAAGGRAGGDERRLWRGGRV